MISNHWIEKRRPYWERLAALAADCQGTARRLGRDELRELALLYRQVANDLSVVRQDGTARSTAHMLNQLLARTHNIIYSSRRRSFLGVLTFLRKDYPRHFRRMLPYTLTAIALFAAGLLLGSVLTITRHGFMESFLGPYMVETIRHHQMWTHSIVGMKPQESSRIMTNNLSVTFITFAAGITAGLGTLWLIFFNGLLMGVIGGPFGVLVGGASGVLVGSLFDEDDADDDRQSRGDRVLEVDRRGGGVRVSAILKIGYSQNQLRPIAKSKQATNENSAPRLETVPRCAAFRKLSQLIPSL